MKSNTIGVLLFSAMLFLSCKQGEEKTTEKIETNTIQKETVIVKDTVKEKEPEGTTIKVNSEGVDVDSKEVKVEVKK